MRRMMNMVNMRRMILAVVSLMLLAGTALAIEFPYFTTTTDSVNLRRSASTAAAVLTEIPAGSDVEVLGESGSYYLLTYDGRTGYAMKEYVDGGSGTYAAAEEEASTAPGYPYATTTNDSVNLRAKKSTSSTRLCSIPEGAQITVHSVSGSYAEVTYKNEKGWCLKKYVNLKTIVKPTATPRPTATLPPVENTLNYQTMQLGSTGSAVRALQEALMELGYLSGQADGIFGKGTQSAVLALQEMNAYPTTGIVDQNLQAHIFSGKPKNSQGKKTEVMTLAPVAGVTIRLNNRGELVGNVQTRLKQLGYYDGAISSVYDSATRKAVTAFQKKNGLTADGVCGGKTQDILFSNAALSPAATPTPVPTPTPTPVPTFQIPAAKVQRGDESEDARLVQLRLIDLGYLNGKADGVFGSASERALKAFQAKHGLNADGVAGSSTFAILFSHNALRVDEVATPAPTAVPVTAAPTVTPNPSYAPVTRENVVTIREGVSGNEVLHLQERLTALGYYDAAMDGVCKLDDLAAIRAFQRANGLKVDGIAGYDTQSLLYSANARTALGELAGGTVDSTNTLRKGMTGPAVQEMQNRLIALGYMEKGTADGNYGVNTAEAVYNFQKRNALVRDGIAGAETLARLYSSSAVSPTPTPAPTTPAPDATITLATSKTLRKGDANDSVKAMQNRLIALGYLTGSADGHFGIQTYKALVAFQRSNSLQADGIAGKQTLSVLSSVNAQGASSGSAGSNTPTATVAPSVSTGTRISASSVRYENWYSVIRAKARTYPYATVYDYQTGISWQVHMFSFGAHADAEPLTAADTARMLQAFGGNTWNPRPLWVILGNGEIYLATSHSMEHGTYHIRDNNFNGHVCFHFPRTLSQVTAIGTYATSHQKAVEKAWAVVQSMAERE